MGRKIEFLFALLILSLIGGLSGCNPDRPAAKGLVFGSGEEMDGRFEIDDSVSLSNSAVTWETYQYELTDFNTILSGSFDGETKTIKTFETWVLENRYLRVTLLPEFGGRILSMIYKPTGHEELYQNPVGVPYQIDTKIFYHDWLMVYGGIFPTFPEPEHGKAWFFPWDFEVIKNTDQEVIVSMSYTDSSENLFAPPQYNLGVTGLKVTYFVRLKAGRAALDTIVRIENPTQQTVNYEYWTNTTLAPGSEPNDPKTTAGAEIIAGVEWIKIPAYWRGIAAQEKKAGLIDVYQFENLRLFENWADMGIAYAFPDMGEGNFWGVINHDNREGIFRIADNSITPGMKIWTWGYPQTAALDPHTTDLEARPYIELWAGLTREFWQRTEISPGSQIEIHETYSPSVGLDNVTHADSNFLLNCDPVQSERVSCQIFGMYPDQDVVGSFFFNRNPVFQTQLSLDPLNGNHFFADLPGLSGDDLLEFRLQDENGNILFTATITTPS